MVTPWNEGASQSPLANPELIQQSPLARADWGDYFGEQISTTGWWNETPSQFVYGPQMNVGESFDYDPGGFGTTYTPTSSLTMQMIDSDIEMWLRREHPELFDFTTGVQYGGVAGVGTVAQDPGFGQFSRTPEVYGEIQAAANKYGVPANFLQAIIAKESSGNWAGNSSPVAVASRGGKRIHGYVGVFEDAAALWGFNFDALTGNRAGQIEMLASGLRRMYDQLHTRNPQYGWLNVAAMHYSGDPDMQYTPGDSFQHGTTQQYVAEAESWWKQLDAQAGNTWSNYTDTTQNTGIGSPQTQTWGRYAQWDEALVGLSANQGAPANLLKSILRFGDESGLGYSNDFDGQFATAATTLTNNYRETGSWDEAIAATFNIPVGSSGHRRIKTYWDELNADGSGVFGGPTRPGGTLPRTQAEAIWGGVPHGISQRNGPSQFANDHPDWYEYSVGVLGTFGHPGDDVTIPEGTTLYAPLPGTVIRAGNTGSYVYGNGDSANSGELRIRLDNGDELILGHTKSISVQVGQRVTPGMVVGVSGWAGTGDHLHLEYRTPDPAMSSGWRSIDPFPALAGEFSGFHQGARTGLGYTQPMTFQALMRAGASGEAIPSGPVYAQGGGRSAWTTWLRNEMLGLGNPDTMQGRLDYEALYSTGNPFGAGAVPNMGVPAQTAGGVATANVVLAQAQRFVGVPYVWGAIPGQGEDPWDTGWDCSGFTYWLDQNYGGGNLPMGSHYQYDYARRNGMITTDTRQLMAGDLVFFDTGSRSGGGAELNGASHVGVYLGGGKMLHAANPSTGTIVSDFNQYTNMYPYLGSMHMAWSGGS